MKEKVYLSGPMTGVPLSNFPAFREAATRLRAAGYDVLSPAELDELAGYYPDEAGTKPADYGKLLLRDLTLIVSERPTKIVLLDGWRRSYGARAEVSLARAMRIECFELEATDEVNLRRVTTGE